MPKFFFVSKCGRFDVRFVNGTLVAFDRHVFKHCETFRTLKLAESAFVSYGYI